MARIVVIGSINMDVVNIVDHHPLPGETVHGHGTVYNPGGKGANQAVAAARAGGDVAMVGAVGQDAFADELLAGLRSYGVDTNAMVRKRGTSGLAFINVDARGENSIILSAGANGQFFEEDVRRSLSLLEGADVLLLQNEVPWETTMFAMREARKKGVKVCLNPAPALRLDRQELSAVDLVIANETEAESMTGVSAVDTPSLRRAAELLLAEGVREIILTLGERGCHFFSQSGEHHHVPAFAVTVADTTAAGDTFVGAFAARSAAGQPVQEALRFASAAAALAVTREGAQRSIPQRDEVEQFLRTHVSERT